MSNRRTLETGTEDLLAHVEDRVAVLTMNRQKVLVAGATGAEFQGVTEEDLAKVLEEFSKYF